MVKIATTSFAVVAILSGTALAQSYNDVYERSVSDYDMLEVREPGFRSAASGAARFLRGHHGHGGHGHGGHRSMAQPQQEQADQQQADPSQPQRREFDEDLEAREPMRFGFPGRFRMHRHSHHGGAGGPQEQQADPSQPERRDFEEDLEAREPMRFGFPGRFRMHRHSHHGGAGGMTQQQPQEQQADPSQPQRRDFEEDIEAREPMRFGFPGRFRMHRHSHHGGAGGMTQQQPQEQQADPSQPQRRDFEEDIEAREPMRFGFASRFLKGHGHGHRHSGGQAPQDQQQQDPSQPQRRELDEELLEARDFYDLYDDLD